MKRTAIYARFSTELQNDRSIEDQIHLCRTHAERQGLNVTATYFDRARSGASVYGRDGLMELLHSARGGSFDVILVESLDRLSRDQEDLAGIWKRLTFAGIELRAVHEGTADQVQIGVRGLLGSLYLADLANKVRRGMDGVVRDGRHAGGRAYGYRPVPGKPGELEIVAGEAAVVCRIFTEYVTGRTPREIAHDLNSEGIPAPRGKRWGASTINGNKARHHGILLNELYAGVLVWNRVRMVKDPDTGRRVSRPNPPEEWKRADAPEMAVVDRALFDAAQARKKDRGHDAPQRQRKARYLLSGLLKCGCCGGGLSVKDRDHGRVRVQCSTRRESGACENARVLYMDEIEAAVLGGLKQHLKTPDLLREFAEAYQRERERATVDKRRLRAGLEAKLAETKRLLDRAWSDYEAERLPTEVIGARMRDLLARQKDLEAELTAAPEAEKVIGLHPGALRQYERYVGDLEGVFAKGVSPETEDAADRIRRLIARVVVSPGQPGFTLRLEGRLAELMEAPTLYPNMRISASGGTVVAEEGLEPPTRGL